MATNQLPINVSVGGDIIDAATDIRKIDIPDPTNASVKKVRVSSMTQSVGSSTIEIRNTVSGGGDGITVTVTNDNYEGTYTSPGDGAALGSITDYIWVRSGTPNGLSDINVTLFIVWS